MNCSVQYFKRDKVTTTLSTNNTVLTEVLGQALPHCNNYMQLSWSVASGIGYQLRHRGEEHHHRCHVVLVTGLLLLIVYLPFVTVVACYLLLAHFVTGVTTLMIIITIVIFVIAVVINSVPSIVIPIDGRDLLHHQRDELISISSSPPSSSSLVILTVMANTGFLHLKNAFRLNISTNDDSEKSSAKRHGRESPRLPRDRIQHQDVTQCAGA